MAESTTSGTFCFGGLAYSAKMCLLSSLNIFRILFLGSSVINGLEMDGLTGSKGSCSLDGLNEGSLISESRLPSSFSSKS